MKTKKSSEKCYPPSQNRTQASHEPLIPSPNSPFWTKLTFAFKTENLGSLYSHALLILIEPSKSKNQGCMNRSLKIS